MFWYTLGYALLVALILTLLFTAIFKNRGPWGSFWIFMIILFLGMWASSLWFEAVGPVWYGIAWVDLLFIGLLLALLMGAAAEAGYRREDLPREPVENREEIDVVQATENKGAASVLFGVFFWIFILLLVGFIIFGLVNFFQMIG